MAILPHKVNQQIKKSLKKLTFFPQLAKSTLWFSLGAILGFFFFASFLYIGYQKSFTNRVYLGVMVDGHDFGGKTKEDVRSYFAKQNQSIHETTVSLSDPKAIATISAKQIGFGYDENLLAQQAVSVGKSDNTLSNISLMLQAYINGIQLPGAYHKDYAKLDQLLKPLQEKIDVKPIDALFNFQNGRVTAFQLSTDGKAVDIPTLKEQIFTTMQATTRSEKPQIMTIKVPVKTIKPNIGTNDAQKLGITELIATGTSEFHHSAESRVYNVNLAASRLNGLLVAPGETFSFVKAVGDISALSGYKQAYVIENGKTVLGDGGGVCQVSTTLFRAALKAGLPIVERHQHAYRVGYYEQDSGPGIDAAIYSPTVDMKFKNDTGHTILIQSYVNYNESQLTFELYGTRDNREVTINDPVILSESPAPETLYQDDPTLPKGEVKQVDFAAAGANVYFIRSVKKDGKIIISDKFVSNYRPWQAIFLRGTKE